MKHFFSGRSLGFTFIEILLVISLLSVISLALYNALSNGLKIWDRGYCSLREENIAIFFDKIRYDFTNALQYSKIRFDGDEDALSFATIVTTKADLKKSSGRQYFVNEIGKVQYVFDKDKHHLYRRQANYSQALNNVYGTERSLVEDIASVTFHYYYLSGTTYEIHEKAQGILPSLVIVYVKFRDGGNSRSLMKIINIPTGG